MIMDKYYEVYEGKMRKTIEVVASEFASVRAGRANPAVLDRLTIEYYGVPTPINQVAAISVPEPRALVIQPWDASILKTVEKAIQASDIGINPQNDGRAIRLNFPPLTEERRKDLIKQVHKYAEEGKIAVRNIRREAIEKFKDMKKKSEVTEDDLKSMEKDMQDYTDKFIKELEAMLSKKEKELLEV